MERLNKFIVVKHSDIEAARAAGVVNNYDYGVFLDFLEDVETYRMARGKRLLKAVTVTDEYPEYEMVWKAIEKRVGAARHPYENISDENP